MAPLYRSRRLSLLSAVVVGLCGAVLMWGCGQALAQTQDVAAPATEPGWVSTVVAAAYDAIPPAWWTFFGGLLPCAGLVVVFVEAVRFFVPSLRREPGVRLGPNQRLVLGGLALAGSQVLAFAGWVTPPWPGSPSVAIAGCAVWGVAVLGNEAIFKRIMSTIYSRVGVAKERKRKARAPDVAP